MKSKHTTKTRHIANNGSEKNVEIVAHTNDRPTAKPNDRLTVKPDLGGGYPEPVNLKVANRFGVDGGAMEYCGVPFPGGPIHKREAEVGDAARVHHLLPCRNGIESQKGKVIGGD